MVVEAEVNMNASQVIVELFDYEGIEFISEIS